MLLAILLAPRLILFLAKVSFTPITSYCESFMTLASASLSISSKVFFLGGPLWEVSAFPTMLNSEGIESVVPGSYFLVWPDNLPVMNAFLMSYSRFLGFVARNAVAGREP